MTAFGRSFFYLNFHLGKNPKTNALLFILLRLIFLYQIFT
nr:MAG TPA: hypothetical protein [Caudoviricetes sp.]